ncbi:DUF155-domain-containing protein [Auricularia subglabra TFB-10046 SS5]|nr:DUF155-domain-containing protein [Auricularia subglabra TFB-10046 SS5]
MASTSGSGPVLPVHSPAPPQGAQGADAKPRGANRSTKVAGKLKVLPEQPDPTTQSRVPASGSQPQVAQPAPAPPVPQTPVVEDARTPEQIQREAESAADADAEDEDEDEEETSDEQDLEDVEVYNAIAQIPEGTARKDALRLTKRKAKSLPRVTAYCTATSYKLDELMKFFTARRNTNKTAARRIDNALYTPYVYTDPPRQSSAPTGDLLGVPELADGGQNGKKKRKRFDAGAESSSEVFLFEYGTVVLWAMTESQERRFLASLKRFEVEKLGADDVELEDLNFYYADHYSRIYNDVITLRKGSSFMTKLALSHALAQSAKISVFEQLISSTIDHTRDIPEAISETGQIGMPHREIMQQIGQLFILRMNLNLVGSVLDSPEVFWSFPDLQPLYDAARSYLEIPQRINLLNTRVEVLQDMLQLLKESVSSRHAERLETIVIWLIVIEIVLGMITVAVDLFSTA